MANFARIEKPHATTFIFEACLALRLFSPAQRLLSKPLCTDTLKMIVRNRSFLRSCAGVPVEARFRQVFWARLPEFKSLFQRQRGGTKR
jgi:hypothetical protein